MRTERKLHTWPTRSITAPVAALVVLVLGACSATGSSLGREPATLSSARGSTPSKSGSPGESQPAASPAQAPSEGEPAVVSGRPLAVTRPSIAEDGPWREPASGPAREEPPIEKIPAYPFHAPLPGPALTASASAMQHANLSPGQCITELRRRELPFKRVGGVSGVANEVRIDGPIRGVRFIAPGGKSPYGVLDCRLALTLDSLASILAAHGVVSVRIDNMYRPRARLPGSRRRSQHAYGLAIDLTVFELSDGRTLDVERDFSGTIGEPVCGPDATLTEHREEAVLLRNIVCDLAAEGVFHHILTPNFNEAHRDHLHLDIKRDARRCGIH